MKTNARLIEGNVANTLIKLTLQMMMGIVAMVAFNLADTFFVGQLGTTQLAAISFTFPVVMVVGSISMGLGVGASAVISRAIGAGNQERVIRLTTDALILAFVIVSLFAFTGLATIEPLFRAIGATDRLLPHIKSYMTIWYLGVPFVVIPMVGNNAIRATGDTKTPSMIMMTAVAVNIVMDPLLIFGIGPFPRLELAGAALATVFGRALTFLFSLWILGKREKMISFQLPPFRLMVESWRNILYIGIPAAGTNLITPISMAVITRLVASFGAEAVAAFGVATRVEMFALTILMALGSVLTPFVGQNQGARTFNRIRMGVRYSQIFSLGWGVLLFGLFLAGASAIAALFNDQAEVVAITTRYLRIISLSYGLQGVLMLSSSALNALRKPLVSAFLAILRMVVLYVPLAMVGSRLFQVNGIFYAGFLANMIAGATAYFLLRKEMAAPPEQSRKM
jgi:putative MATE family efflux protein